MLAKWTAICYGYDFRDTGQRTRNMGRRTTNRSYEMRQMRQEIYIRQETRDAGHETEALDTDETRNRRDETTGDARQEGSQEIGDRRHKIRKTQILRTKCNVGNRRQDIGNTRCETQITGRELRTKGFCKPFTADLF